MKHRALVKIRDARGDIRGVVIELDREVDLVTLRELVDAIQRTLARPGARLEPIEPDDGDEAA